MEIMERNMVGKYESWEEVIVNVDAGQTPYTSMATKQHKPVDVIDNWQVESYDDSPIRGVPDGKDASDFRGQQRKRIKGVIQKTWHNPGVSDLATEVKVHGNPQGEMARQIAKSLVQVKRQIEKRNLSALDQRDTDDGTRGYETRGNFSWLDVDAQDTLPVPDGFRPTSACYYSGTLANFTETQFKTMQRAGFKLRKGPTKLDGFCGIDLLQKFADFRDYADDVASMTTTRSLNMSAEARALINVVQRLETQAGTVDLHPVSFLKHDLEGVEQDGTHLSGLFLDMSMFAVNWIRKPRVLRLEYKGGGEKAIVDAIWMNKCLNPLGHLAADIDS
jgi:hypothetical protein